MREVNLGGEVAARGAVRFDQRALVETQRRRFAAQLRAEARYGQGFLDVQRAARLLGIDQRNLPYYMRKHDIDPSRIED